MIVQYRRLQLFRWWMARNRDWSTQNPFEKLQFVYYQSLHVTSFSFSRCLQQLHRKSVVAESPCCSYLCMEIFLPPFGPELLEQNIDSAFELAEKEKTIIRCLKPLSQERPE